MAKRGKTTNNQRNSLMERDGGLCGIHLGGCSQPIMGQCEKDEIVPLGLIEKISPPQLIEYRKLWNCQPMHPECNRRKADRLFGRRLTPLEQATILGSNAPDDWPRFQCKCHYLQILDKNLCVGTLAPLAEGEHLLCPEIVRDYEGNLQDAMMVIGQWKGEGGQLKRGYDGGRGKGYTLSSFSSKRVPGFNIMERQRVGLPTPAYIYIDEHGNVPWASVELK